MNQNLRIATCQFPVSGDIPNNAKYVRRFMKKAADASAHVIHFPETSLLGYGRADLKSANADSWRSLEEQTKEITDLAKELGIWVVLGTCRIVTGTENPANCIRIISNTGRLVGTYDKQKLTPAESAWYTPGEGFVTVTINGIKCGFLICYELCFPTLFEAYREKGVQLIFHSCHNVSSKPRPVFQELTLAQLRTRAADNQMWISSSTSSARHSFSTSCVARPDGTVRSLKRHASGILLHDLPDTDLGWTYDNTV
jgi:deaminated glutathione amidase